MTGTAMTAANFEFVHYIGGGRISDWAHEVVNLRLTR